MTVEVCLTPELIHQHVLAGKVAVVIDIFRATSCMVTGLSEGVAEIYPVETVEECLELGKKGMITAGERGGQKIPEFDIGNSPFSYREEGVKGKKIAVSTTNGTLTLKRSLEADEILVAGFLNISATVNYLNNQNKSIVLHCAGWKGTPNIEDTLFAGAVAQRCKQNLLGDSALIAAELYKTHSAGLLEIAKESGHAERLAGFGVKKDIEFCMTEDVYESVIRLDGDHLVRV